LKQQKVSALASSLLALLSGLPSMLLYKWLSCVEMSKLLTSANVPLDINYLRASCTQATKVGNLECRMFGRASVRFHRLSGMELSSTLSDEQQSKWLLPQLASDYFAAERYFGNVKVVNDFISFNETIGVKKRKVSSELPANSISTPPRKTSKTTLCQDLTVTPTTVMPSPKSKGTSHKACQGWKGENYNGLFLHSFQKCLHCVGMEISTPPEIALSPIYKNYKDSSKLAFFSDGNEHERKIMCYAPESAPDLSALELLVVDYA
jgi:hypothetical protein